MCFGILIRNIFDKDEINLYEFFFLTTGIEQSATRFSVIVTNMKKKPYDFLDQRKTEFEVDFDEFKRMVAELHVSL